MYIFSKINTFQLNVSVPTPTLGFQLMYLGTGMCKGKGLSLHHAKNSVFQQNDNVVVGHSANFKSTNHFYRFEKKLLRETLLLLP